MTDRVAVSRDRTRLLPPNSPEKGFLITRDEAADLGLTESPDKPTQQRRTEPVPQKRRYTKRK